MQTHNWKVATDSAHVLLLVAMFSFGTVATIVYFRVTARLESIGEATPRLLGRKDVFKMFRKYEEVADQYSWPKWLPLAYWGALMLALISGMAYVYYH